MSYHSNVGQPDSEQNRIDSLLHLLAEKQIEAFKTHLTAPRLDHNDPSKPSHRLINGTEPSKTIESDGNKIKNHWKTIDSNGQTAEKYSMVMVSSKTIENLQWSLQNQIHNGFLKTIGLVNGPLKSTLS